MLYYLAGGVPGQTGFFLCYIFSALNLFFLTVTYYYSAIFTDYTIFKDSQRTKKVTVVGWIICGLHLLVILVNFKGQFYFFIDAQNYFSRGSLYFIRSFFTYSPLLIVIYDFISSRKIFKERHLYMVVFFAITCSFGSSLDILFNTARLILPCLAASLLYAYFFVIRSDIQIDVLTGIGNRYSFNEFIDKLSRINTSESYSIVMIDMDHLKIINDTLLSTIAQ